MPESVFPPVPERPVRILAHTNLHVIFAVTLMVVMGVSSVAPAFPRVKAAMGLSAMEVGWLVTAFTLPGVFLTPVFGVAADHWGRKAVLAPALVAFAVFGAACGFVDTFAGLLTLRFMQGVGAAPLGVLNATLIGDLYQGRERITAMGLNAGVLSLGTTIYPALGGLLATLGWHYPFMLPVVALPLALWVGLVLDAPRPQRSASFRDYVAGTLRLVLDPRALGLFGLTAATFLILYGLVITYLPLYLHARFGASPTVIGLVIATASLTTALMAGMLGSIAKVLPMRVVVTAGFGLYAVSALTLPLCPTAWWAIGPMLLFGMGQGLNIPSVQTLLTSLAPMERRAAFMAVNGTVLRLGQTLGPMVMGVAYGWWGMDGMVWATAGLAVAMMGVAMVCTGQGGRDGGH